MVDVSKINGNNMFQLAAEPKKIETAQNQTIDFNSKEATDEELGIKSKEFAGFIPRGNIEELLNNEMLGELEKAKKDYIGTQQLINTGIEFVSAPLIREYDKDGNLIAIYNVQGLEKAKILARQGGIEKTTPSERKTEETLKDNGFDTTSPSDLESMAEYGLCESEEVTNKEGEKGTKYTLPDGSSYIVYEHEGEFDHFSQSRTPNYQTMECYDENGNLVQSGQYKENGDYELTTYNEDGSTTTASVEEKDHSHDINGNPNIHDTVEKSGGESDTKTDIKITTTFPNGQETTQHIVYNPDGSTYWNETTQNLDPGFHINVPSDSGASMDSGFRIDPLPFPIDN